MSTVTPEVKLALKDIEIDDDAHWLLGDYGREARTWGHVDVLFATNMLSMEGDALEKLKKKALITYHLKVHSETFARVQGLSTIAEIILMADEAHKNLISALKQLEKDTVNKPELRNTEFETNTYASSQASHAPARARHALAQASHAPVRAGQAPAQASHAPVRVGKAPAQASHAPVRAGHTLAQAFHAPARAIHTSTQASYTPARVTHTPTRASHAPARAYHTPTQASYTPTRASGVRASVARQAAIREANEVRHGRSPPDAMAE